MDDAKRIKILNDAYQDMKDKQLDDSIDKIFDEIKDEIWNSGWEEASEEWRGRAKAIFATKLDNLISEIEGNKVEVTKYAGKHQSLQQGFNNGLDTAIKLIKDMKG